MIYNVRMLAHHSPHHIRPVYVPDHYLTDDLEVDYLLDLIYRFGQNEFACGPDADSIRRSTCSLDVGDVIELVSGENYMVASLGFKLLSPTDYEKYKMMDRDDRWMFARSVGDRQ